MKRPAPQGDAVDRALSEGSPSDLLARFRARASAKPEDDISIVGKPRCQLRLVRSCDSIDVSFIGV